MKYTLEVRKIKNDDEFFELKKELDRRQLIGTIFDNGYYPAIKHDAVFQSVSDLNWQKHANDMIMISEMFPKMYFELNGVESYQRDFWKEYYHDGIVEACHGEIVYEQPRKVQWTELIEF